MPRMIELIRQSAVPANVMRSAAKGALTLPPGEMIEILVYLTCNPLFAEQAKMTLAGWDIDSAIAVAANPTTAWEVLTYMIAPENLRPKLVPVLVENPSVREAAILELAQKASRELIETLLSSRRVRRSSAILHAVLANPAVTEAESAQIESALKQLGEGEQQIEAHRESAPAEKTQWEIEHAAEIAAEEAKAEPFSLFGQDAEAEDLEQLEPVAPIEADTALAPAEVIAEVQPETPAIAAATAQAETPIVAADTTAASNGAAAGGAAAAPKRALDPKVKERLSTLQKIARLSVGERIQLAMKGSKEERFVLVRDGSKLVSQAVLQSPKVSDAEVEGFAGMKNVQEGVLREIARNHKFMKNYAVVRTLANNPRTPLDLSLGLMNHLMVNDLKGLSMNKNVPETLRKLALKKFKEKTEKKQGG